MHESITVPQPRVCRGTAARGCRLSYQGSGQYRKTRTPVAERQAGRARWYSKAAASRPTRSPGRPQQRERILDAACEVKQSRQLHDVVGEQTVAKRH